jgi:hypothetical protein
MRAFWTKHQQKHVQERRIGAALMACKDISTAGLEEIAARGLTMELALTASMLVESDKARERKEVEALVERFIETKEGD